MAGTVSAIELGAGTQIEAPSRRCAVPARFASAPLPDLPWPVESAPDCWRRSPLPGAPARAPSRRCGVLNRVGELVSSKGPVGHHRKPPVNIESTLSPLWGGQSCPQPPLRRPEPAKKPSPEGAPGQDWPPHNWVFIIIGGPQGHEDSLLSCAAVRNAFTPFRLRRRAPASWPSAR
jgi:hypothetical protein